MDRKTIEIFAKHLYRSYYDLGAGDGYNARKERALARVQEFLAEFNNGELSNEDIAFSNKLESDHGFPEPYVAVRR